MNIFFIILGVLVGLFVIYAVFSYKKLKNMPMPDDNEKIVTLNSGNFETTISKGLAVVDFWAAWCGPCKMLAPVLNSVAETESDKITVCKVNVDEENQLSSRFGVRGIPTLIFFKEGKEVKRLSGIKSKNQIVAEINKLL